MMEDVSAAAGLNQDPLLEFIPTLANLPWEDKLFKRVVTRAIKSIQAEDARNNPAARGNQEGPLFPNISR